MPSSRPIKQDAPLPDLTSKIIQSDDEYHGIGGFGDVYKRLYRDDDGVKEVAVKVFRFQFTLDEDQGDEHYTKMIRRELGLCRRLHHRNIVPFLGIAYGFGMKGNASLVSSWMSNGGLDAYLKVNDGQLTITRRLELLMDIAEGLNYLHSFPIMHGDLKDTNVLLDSSNRARLADFGNSSLVQTTPEAIDFYLQASRARPGAVRWTAPELCTDEDDIPPPTTKIDIYSFGNLALLLLSGKLPWAEIQNDMRIIIKLSRGETPSRPESRPISDPHWNLIKQCWSQVPERPSAEDLISAVQGFLRDLGVRRTVYHVPTSPDHGGLRGSLRRKFVDLIRQASSQWVNLDPRAPIHVGSYGTIDRETGDFLVHGNIYSTEFQQELDKTGARLRITDHLPIDGPTEDNLILCSPGLRRRDLSATTTNITAIENFEFSPGRSDAVAVISNPRRRYMPRRVQLHLLYEVPMMRNMWLVMSTISCSACSFYMSDKAGKMFSLEFPDTTVRSSGIPAGAGGMSEPYGLTPLYVLKRRTVNIGRLVR